MMLETILHYAGIVCGVLLAIFCVFCMIIIICGIIDEDRGGKR